MLPGLSFLAVLVLAFVRPLCSLRLGTRKHSQDGSPSVRVGEPARQSPHLPQSLVQAFSAGTLPGVTAPLLAALLQTLLEHQNPLRLPAKAAIEGLARMESNDGQDLPQMVFEHVGDLEASVVKYVTKETVLVMDSWSHGKLADKAVCKKRKCFSVTGNYLTEWKEILGDPQFSRNSRVIGVGACGVLDVARAISVGKELIIVPTLLSTDCVISNRFVWGDTSNGIACIGSTPKVIHFDTALLGANSFWTIAGFGDLLAGISAWMDRQVGARAPAQIEADNRAAHLAPEALEYYHDTVVPGFLLGHLDGFSPADPESWQPFVEQLMHEFAHHGEDVIKLSSNLMYVGGEHAFCRAVISVEPAMRELGPPHGLLVGLGVLLSAREYMRINEGDDTDYFELLSIFDKAGIPYRVEDYTIMGLFLDHVDGDWLAGTRSQVNYVLDHMHKNYDYKKCLLTERPLGEDDWIWPTPMEFDSETFLVESDLIESALIEKLTPILQAEAQELHAVYETWRQKNSQKPEGPWILLAEKGKITPSQYRAAVQELVVKRSDIMRAAWQACSHVYWEFLDHPASVTAENLEDLAKIMYSVRRAHAWL